MLLWHGGGDALLRQMIYLIANYRTPHQANVLKKIGALEYNFNTIQLEMSTNLHKVDTEMWKDLVSY